MADETQAGNSGAEQQQVAGGGAPAIDYGALYATLSDDNAKAFTAKGFDKSGANGGPVDVNLLMETIRSADALMGKNNLPQPDLVTDGELGKWPGWKALGVPDKPEGYQLKRPEMPKGADGKPLAYDEEGEKVVRQAMLKAKVPPKLAQGLYDELTAMQLARVQAVHQEIEQDRIDTDTALTKEWGAKKATQIARAANASRQLAEKIGIDPNLLNRDANAFLGSAGVVKLFAFLADQLGEDIIVPADGRVGDMNTPAGAKATLAAKEADPEFIKALNSAEHPQHRAAVELRRKLNAIANGG